MQTVKVLAFDSGYLSDCYFVAGKVAPPTTFGKYFPGDKWGPLDSSLFNNLNNLQPEAPTPPPGPGAAGQPYDDRANTDQVWSDNVSTQTEVIRLTNQKQKHLTEA